MSRIVLITGASSGYGKATAQNHIDEIPPEALNVDVGDWSPNTVISAMVKYPNGDVNVNMLPTIQGKEFFTYGARADDIGRARVYRYWHYLQTERNFEGYTLKHIFNAGIRESYRFTYRSFICPSDKNHALNGRGRW
ncbi:MAG: hypothetical protein IJ428_00980 [Clostridia bacterium]|nr:hypothetical protein [Clostridia bacterium]